MSQIITPAGADLLSIGKQAPRVGSLPLFYDDFRGGFLDGAKWSYGIVSSGSVTVSDSVPGVAGMPSGATLASGATSGGQAYIATRSALILPHYGQTALTTIIERTNIEWTAKAGGTWPTAAHNTVFFMGIAKAVGASGTRGDNDITGFYLESDVLAALSDKGGTETTAALTSAPAMTAVHKYRVALDRVNGYTFFVDDVLQATVATNVNNIYACYIVVILRNDSAANVSLALGNVRAWSEDLI